MIDLKRLPNLRTLIVPDPGYTIIDMDLDRADVNIVAWESGDLALKEKLLEERRNPEKNLHIANAISIFGTCTKDQYRFAKVFAHGTNYGATPPTIARQLGITIKEAEKAQARWFAVHPGIQQWHHRIKEEVRTKKSVSNKFGYRIVFFDRPDSCFNEALAWVPASTVALVAHKAMVAVEDNVTDVQVLLNGHDSLVFQTRTELLREKLPEIERHSLITIPYDDPLVIPVGFSISDKTWGDVKEIEKWWKK